MKWYFPRQLPGQVETEITQRDQFSNDDVELSETIIREALQNSLDAAVDDPAKVKVSIRLVGVDDGLSPSFVEGLVREQRVHAEAANLDLDSIDKNYPTALVIEDFGTKGLTGSVDSRDEDNFSDFWRRHGKSHKTGKSRGRWGLGKLVYSSTSMIGAFFGVTIREEDQKPYLMGQTVLNLRKLEGIEYPPHGFFADLEGEGDPYREIAVPIKNQSLVADFFQQFSLKRDKETGLSVIIPFPNPKFSVDSLIGTAIANYFYPILTGQLTLEFDELLVDEGSVRSLAHKYASDKLSDIDLLFDFIEGVYGQKEVSIYQLKPSWSKNGKLLEEDFESEELEKARELYLEGKIVGLKLPLSLTRKDNTRISTFFSVFIQQPETLGKGVDLYVRGGLTLPGEAKFRDRKALGAMIAEDEEICSFLGYAENAAHTQWVGSAEKLKQHYKAASKVVRAVKQALVEFYDLLSDNAEQVDEHALRSFFWIEQPEAEKSSKKKPKPKATPIDIPPPPEPRPKDFAIRSVDGGFIVSTTANTNPDRFPQEVTVKVAYDVATGDPFKKYSPLDFKLGNKSLAVTLTEGSGKVLAKKQNTLRFRVERVPFQITVVGFDDNRDLKIKLSRKGAGSAENN